MKRVEFDPSARHELDHAADDYEADYPGRGLRFYAAVERAVRLIAETPRLGRRFPGTPEEVDVRRVLVKHFPFAIAYRELGDVIRIDAVAHTRRKPGYWLGRVDD